jgi:hypothetical protein
MVKIIQSFRTADSHREQERDEERARFGSQGAASECRKIDVASVDAAALLARQEQASRRARGPVEGRIRQSV